MAVGRYQHAHAASTYSYILTLSRPLLRRRRPRLSFLFIFLPQLSRPFTVILLPWSLPHPPLMCVSLSLLSQPLTPITTFLSSTSPIFLCASLFSPISPINIGYLPVFHVPISARRSLRLLRLFLLKLHPDLASSALPAATGFYYLGTLYGATAIIITSIVLTRLFRKKKKSIDLHRSLSFSLPRRQIFLQTISSFFPHIASLRRNVRFFSSASCISVSWLQDIFQKSRGINIGTKKNF